MPDWPTKRLVRKREKRQDKLKNMNMTKSLDTFPLITVGGTPFGVPVRSNATLATPAVHQKGCGVVWCTDPLPAVNRVQNAFMYNLCYTL